VPGVDGDVQVAFAWRGVARYGTASGGLRVRLRPVPGDGTALLVADDHGRAVLSVDELVVRPIDAEQLRAAGGEPRPVSSRPAEAPAAPAGPLRRLSALSPDERGRALLAIVREQAMAVLGHDDPGEIGPERAFQEVGFDSLTAMRLRERLTRETGVRLRPTAVFDFPTPARLAAHLDEQLAESLSPATPVLADLARLGAALPGVLAGDGVRDQLAERLRQMLALVETDPEAAAGAGGEPDDLDDASDDDLFSMIDKGFA
jgi:acyl carrier protein